MIVCRTRDLGLPFKSNDAGIFGQDGATSIVLDAERALWVFGDSIIHPFDNVKQEEITQMLTNSACIVPRQDASNGLGKFEYLKDGKGIAREIICFLPSENPGLRRLWGIHGVTLGKKIYIYYHLVRLFDAVNPFEMFDLDGMGIAKGSVDDFQFVRLEKGNGGTILWDGAQPTWGVWTVKSEAESRLYLFGMHRPKGSKEEGGFIHLARVSLADIEKPDAYEYLVEAPTLQSPQAKARWSKSFEPTAPLLCNVPNEMSVSYNAYLKRYIAIRMIGIQNRLAIQSALALEGPWGEPEVFCQPEKTAQGMSFYAAKEHPELALEGGKRIFVTYVDTGDYLPHLLELTLA